MVVKQLEQQAAEFGKIDFSLSEKALRSIKKSTGHILRSASREVLKDYIRKLAKEVEGACGGIKDGSGSAQVARPDEILSTENTTTTTTTAATGDTPVESAANDDANVPNGMVEDADDFLLELKEEMQLSNLLLRKLKRNGDSRSIHNGESLLLLAPPDTQSSDTFLQHEQNTEWVDELLVDNERVYGMTSYLARKHRTDTQLQLLRSFLNRVATHN